MAATEAFAALWPILLTLGGGYAGLLLFIRQQFEQRLREKDAELTRLRERLDKREEVVWRSLSTAETVAALAQSLAGAREQTS